MVKSETTRADSPSVFFLGRRRDRIDQARRLVSQAEWDGLQRADELCDKADALVRESELIKAAAIRDAAKVRRDARDEAAALLRRAITLIDDSVADHGANRQQAKAILDEARVALRAIAFG